MLPCRDRVGKRWQGLLPRVPIPTMWSLGMLFLTASSLQGYLGTWIEIQGIGQWSLASEDSGSSLGSTVRVHKGRAPLRHIRSQDGVMGT